MDTQACVAWVRESARLISANAERLTQLDTAIGDGDHGANMRRGFDAALAALEENEPATPAAVLIACGGALISKTGGASGPLYGTAFRRAGRTLADVADADAGELGAALRAALDAVQQLGAATRGDKTMVDALTPAVTAYEEAVDSGAELAAAALAAADAASKGTEATAPMRARRGRASYLGERSIGHEDPGASSTALIMQALANVTADRGTSGE